VLPVAVPVVSLDAYDDLLPRCAGARR
jgi:hypothetical protein